MARLKRLCLPYAWHRYESADQPPDERRDVCSWKGSSESVRIVRTCRQSADQTTTEQRRETRTSTASGTAEQLGQYEKENITKRQKISNYYRLCEAKNIYEGVDLQWKWCKYYLHVSTVSLYVVEHECVWIYLFLQSSTITPRYFPAVLVTDAPHIVQSFNKPLK